MDKSLASDLPIVTVGVALVIFIGLAIGLGYASGQRSGKSTEVVLILRR